MAGQCALYVVATARKIRLRRISRSLLECRPAGAGFFGFNRSGKDRAKVRLRNACFLFPINSPFRRNSSPPVLDVSHGCITHTKKTGKLCLGESVLFTVLFKWMGHNAT